MTFEKTIVMKYTNTSTTPVNVSLSQTYTSQVQVQLGVTVGAEATLEAAFKVSAGVDFSYSLTTAVSTQYGTSMTVQPKTIAEIDANPISTCYAFHEQYYLLGVAVGNPNTIGVFKPTGAHWYYGTSPYTG